MSVTITQAEKAEMLKDTISFLYSKEGRSKNYISQLLSIDRKTLTNKIKEWDLPEAEPRHHMTPSTEKFIKQNRTLIKARLDNDVPITKIAEELKTTRYVLQKTIIPSDEVLSKAHQDYINRMHSGAQERKQNLIDVSSRDYDYEKIPGEQWKPILGYNGYEVSDYGRIRKYVPAYDTYYLMRLAPNKNNGRLYVCITDGQQRKNLMVARIVAHAFVPGYDAEHCTVNHEDGDVTNNKASNLTWMSQARNNSHAHMYLPRKDHYTQRRFQKIIYKGKYEFKTIRAFSKFIGKSVTQTSRYLDNPEKYDIRLVK